MDNLTTQLHTLLLRVETTDPSKRYRFQSELGQLIARMKLEGVPVKHSAQQLNEELHNDAVEAQFDNMPV